MDSIVSGGMCFSLFCAMTNRTGFAGLVSSVLFHPVDSFKAHAQFQLKVTFLSLLTRRTQNFACYSD